MQKLLTLTTALLTLFALVPAAFAGWEEGVAAFRAGDYRGAASEFRALSEASSEAPQSHYMLGLSLVQGGQAETAAASLSKAVELAPDNADYRLALVQTQLKLGRSNDAVAALADQDPTAMSAAQRTAFGKLLAKAAMGSDRDRTSFTALEKALEVDEGSKPLWLARAQIAQRLERSEDAFTALRAAFRLDPHDLELGRRAVRTAHAVGQDLEGEERSAWYTRGSALATELTQTAPTAEHLLLAGEGRMGTQDYVGAGEWFEKAAAADSRDPLPHFYLARCALAVKQPDIALSHLDPALERTPEPQLRSSILETRGAALRHLQRFTEAAEAYRQAGNEDKAGEMVRFAEIKKNNKDWDRQKSLCEEKQQIVREELADNDFLEGTAGWRKLVQEAEDKLADCQPYLSEAS